jgi:hypothetical protein
MGARNRAGIGLLYRPIRLQRLAELIPVESILGLLKSFKIRALNIHATVVCQRCTTAASSHQCSLVYTTINSSYQYGLTYYDFHQSSIWLGILQLQKSSIWPDILYMYIFQNQQSSVWSEILQLPAVINMARYSTAFSSHQYGQIFYSFQQSSIWSDILQLSAVINMVRYSTAFSSHQYGQIFYSFQQSSIWSDILQLPAAINMDMYSF